MFGIPRGFRGVCPWKKNQKKMNASVPPLTSRSATMYSRALIWCRGEVPRTR